MQQNTNGALVGVAVALVGVALQIRLNALIIKLWGLLFATAFCSFQFK